MTRFALVALAGMVIVLGAKVGSHFGKSPSKSERRMFDCGALAAMTVLQSTNSPTNGFQLVDMAWQEFTSKTGIKP